MNKWVEKLSVLASSNQRTILGLMSGTSMDGLDMALCRVSNDGSDTRLVLDKFQTVPLDSKTRQKFYELAFREESCVSDVQSLNRQLTDEWITIIGRQLGRWKFTSEDIDLIASHGQTLLHLPGEEAGNTLTLQLVDGGRLAQRTGVITVSDFRQKHISAGYEGAPLAPLAEQLLYRDKTESRILLNLGGISNFTFLPAGEAHLSRPVYSDCGPANTLLDESIKRLVPGHDYDPDGVIARSGQVYEPLLELLLSNDFFKKPIPKSTGQETFNWHWLHSILLSLDIELETKDLLATLTEFSAIAISKVLEEVLHSSGHRERTVLYVSGGGVHNLFLMDRLGSHLPELTINDISELGITSDAKEAALFAVLANESLFGEGWHDVYGNRFTLGSVSFP